MDELKERLVEKLKKIKGLDSDEADEVLLFAIETAIYDVLNYCHLEIEEWLEDLDNTTILMAIDILNEANYSLNAENVEGDVKELNEGDFKISRETKSDLYKKMASVPSFSKNYRRILNRFRRLAR